MKSLFFLLLTGCLFLLSAADQKRPVYPQDHFIPPVDVDLYLSGTFGEVRSTHFHSGIDIKTEQREGLHVCASASGYVSRIKVSPYGFGKALYLTHPNGYVTVYAHLQRFSPEIEAYVKKQQYQKKRFKIELFPGPDQFRVAQGEWIAISGNTGGSAGPHLHFEIRDGATQKPINPLLFGFDVKDEIPPVMDLLALYSYREGLRQEAQLYPIRTQGSKLELTSDTLYSPNSTVAFGVRSFDRLNGASNKNGLYSLKMYADSRLTYHFEMEKFAFSETRYVGCHIDQQLKKERAQVVQRCYVLPGNRFSGYRQVVQQGILDIDDGLAHQIRIEAEDAKGNLGVLNFYVQHQKQQLNEDSMMIQPVFVKQFRYDQYNTYRSEDFRISIPKGVLFEDLSFEHDTSSGLEGNSFSSIHHIHYPTVAVFKYFDISLKAIELPADLQRKALIASIGADGSFIAEGGSFDNGFVSTRTRSFGDYFVTIDTTAPVVTALNFGEGQEVKDSKVLKVRITDDLSGIESYAGKIDGMWILMEYDVKNDLLFHEIDEKVKPGSHEFVLEVKDAKGNTSLFKTSLIIKQ